MVSAHNLNRRLRRHLDLEWLVPESLALLKLPERDCNLCAWYVHKSDEELIRNSITRRCSRTLHESKIKLSSYVSIMVEF